METKQKEVIIFDLDGTLTESKQMLDSEMADLLKQLLSIRRVAVISGGSYKQMNKQFVAYLPKDTDYKNLFIFPVSATALYRHIGTEWCEIYSEKLSKEDKDWITSIILDAEAKLHLASDKVYGDKIEDRGSQITYSALGQNAPLEAKKVWDPNQNKRQQIVKIIAPLLKKFTVGIGGMTSIDVTRAGIDKGFGIKQISKTLGVPISTMVFVGDALFPGGNDFPVKATGIDCVEVVGVNDTKDFIRKFLKDNQK